ncbi:MAG: sugar phosphate isomerase/epimerase [Christensenellaceae bacterium]|jgi:sugar phosphate isomerase/epimerase|nr:sugar phosphate isomerase/epimerase [Christensenellaceae bacterium]
MFYISGFFDEAYGNLDAQIALAKKLNVGYLCPRGIDGKNVSNYDAAEFQEKVLPRLNKNNIKLSSLGSPIGKVGIDDENGYQAQVAKLKELVKIAQLSDTKYIRCFSFFTNGDNGEATKAKVIERWKGFLQTVEGTDTVLLHENEKKIFGDTPERALALYHALNHPNFKLCYDASNYIQCGVDPWKAYEATKEFTVYYHMKDAINGIEVPLGMGEGHIKEILADLAARGYDGFLTLEPHTAKYALLKRVFYCLFPLQFTKAAKVYRQIDKQYKIGAFKGVSREQVFVWQHENLTKILDEIGGNYGK